MWLVGDGQLPTAVAEPGLAIGYRDAMIICPNNPTGVPYSVASANGWLLRDAAGSLLVTSGGCYVADVGSAAYQQAFTQYLHDWLSRYHPDGWFLDNFESSTLWAVGKYPAKYPDQTAWEDAQFSFAAQVTQPSKNQGYYVLGNVSGWCCDNTGLHQLKYYNRAAPYFSGMMSEHWMFQNGSVRVNGTPVNSYDDNFENWIQLPAIAQAAGDDFVSTDTIASSDSASMKYVKAAFLLAWDGGHGTAMVSSSYLSGDPWNINWTADIGQPIGAKYAVGSGFRRDYTGGTVLLNPSYSSSQFFSLGGTYHKLDGSAATSVTLAPGTAEILTS